jgi:hypothetical protein
MLHGKHFTGVITVRELRLQLEEQLAIYAMMVLGQYHQAVVVQVQLILAHNIN